jgi:hypothetical protein
MVSRHHEIRYWEVLGLYLERPLENCSRLRDLGWALQIQRLEGSLGNVISCPRLSYLGRSA